MSSPSFSNSNWNDAGHLSNEELETRMIFAILDRAQSYGKVVAAFNALKAEGIINRSIIKNTTTEEEIAKILKSVGYRFPNQTAKHIYEFGSNITNLRTATRDELVENINGVGPKIASLFLRNTRGENVLILDIHVKRWLAERGYDTTKPYEDLEKDFIAEAKKLGKDPRDLDLEIWQERRVKSKVQT